MHKSGSATTLCQVLKVKTRTGVVVGVTNLDNNVIYDDGKGDGLVHYHAPVGFDPASMYNSSTTEVGNTEFKSLAPVYDFPINVEAVNAGDFDYADYWVYEVNYNDLSMGHWTVMSGKLGEMRSQDGTIIWGELRSIMDQLKKPLVPLYSRTCRSIFGSDSTVERIPCGFDTTDLWVFGEVVSTFAEPTRVFTVSITDPEEEGLAGETGKFSPGMLQILSGKNSGRYVEIESYEVEEETITVALNFPLAYPVLPGATFRIREDCSKQARDELKGCKRWYGDQWPHHFNGEPDIPLGDSGSLATPGAANPWDFADRNTDRLGDEQQ